MARKTWGYTFDRNNTYQPSPFRQNRKIEQVKHSGAKWKEAVNGKIVKPVMYGWNYSKTRGMITFIASPYKKTKRVKSANGKEWENWFVKIFNKRTLQELKTSGLYDVANRRLIISDLGMIATLKGSGGYFGTFKK